MSFINAKDDSKHEDATITNNGGIVVIASKGSTPKQAVGTKSTQTPNDQGGHNKAVKESSYVGKWYDGAAKSGGSFGSVTWDLE